MVVGLPTEKDLEDECRRRASVLSLLSLSLFSSIQVWMSDRQVSREDIADWMFGGGTETLSWALSAEDWDNRVTLNQVRKRFCAEDEENWAQHRTLWHTVGKASDLRDAVIDDDWLCSICQMRRKPRRVQYQRCHTCVGVGWEVRSSQLCQKQLKDPRVSEEKHCESQAHGGCHVLVWEGLFQWGWWAD